MSLALWSGRGLAGVAIYPPDHLPGRAVPQGGSMCGNCRFLAPDRENCTSQHFIEWNGSPRIPGQIDAYCSDWYVPA